MAPRRDEDDGDVEAARVIQPLVGRAQAEGIQLGDLLAEGGLLLRIAIDLDDEGEAAPGAAHLGDDFDERIGHNLHLALDELTGYRLQERHGDLEALFVEEALMEHLGDVDAPVMPGEQIAAEEDVGDGGAVRQVLRAEAGQVAAAEAMRNTHTQRCRMVSSLQAVGEDGGRLARAGGTRQGEPDEVVSLRQGAGAALQIAVLVQAFEIAAPLGNGDVVVAGTGREQLFIRRREPEGNGWSTFLRWGRGHHGRSSYERQYTIVNR